MSRECRHGFYIQCLACDLLFGYEPNRGGVYDVGGLVELIQTWNRSLGRPVRVIMEPFTISLAAARVNAGLTQREAAEKLGTNQRYIGLYENRKIPIPQNVLRQLAKLYGIRVGQIKEAGE
ncbi:MAG TPA: helix-turn-helix transcriptional regulator [Clostridia bacterium]|nr:helix-turn-helix transcriptional regulator [Clostridia bacterium]